jgi:hypothetical protein
MRAKIFVILAGIILFGFTPLQAEEISQSVDFTTADLVFSSSQGFDILYLKNCDITNQAGEPQLPVKLIHVALPPGSQVEQVVVTKTESQTLPGDYLIFPAQPPQVLSATNKPLSLVQPKSTVYNQLKEYPGKLVEFSEAGFLGGYELAGILVYPVQYVPAQKKIKLYSHIEFKIYYTPGGKTPLPVKTRTRTVKAVYEEIIRKADSHLQARALTPTGDLRLPSLLPPGDYEYVVVTDTTFVSAFQPLTEWKTKKGVPAKIVTTGWIYAHYSGYDNAEKVRNFIKDAYQNWGTVWVLLGGDTNVVPARIAWAMDCEAGYYPDENDIRCDLYFSDLDGNWDANGNHTYGEVDDSVDMYPDVFVGRASCSTVAKAQALVTKLLTYELNPPTDYQTKMLFFAQILWSSPYTNSGLAKDLIDETYVPSQFDPITKLYEALGNESKATVLAAMNVGQNIINHDGHANYSVMGAGSGYLYNSDMDGLYNGPRNSILFSIGCWPAAFDYDCIAEHFINNPNGGGVAFIGNSRYGWGSPGNPEYGYSDRYDREFFAALFARDSYQIGKAVAGMKTTFIPRAQQENVYRWCMYEINLLGDPEMPIWTDSPKYLTVEYPDTIPQGSSLFAATVIKTGGGSQPVSGALVCLMKEGEVYQRGLTDSQGQISFNVSPATAGQLYVTVTAHNFMPCQDSARVTGNGAYVVCQSRVMNDTAGGNGDGKVSPGETVGMRLELKNYGNDTAYQVSATLHSTGDPYLTLIDSTQNYGNLNPGEALVSPGTYDFSVASNCPGNHVAYFDLAISDAGGGSWQGKVVVTVVAPDLKFRSYAISDLSGNNNGIPEPGETFDMKVSVENEGGELAREVTGILSTSNPYFSVNDSSAGFASIPFGETGSGIFGVSVAPDCPLNNFPYFRLQTSTSDGFVFQDSFRLTIGEPGFADNMEAGASQWTHGGTGDLWHLSNHRSHSGNSSWYSGIEGSWYFNDNMNCWVKSSPFILGPSSYLSFWLWYDVTNYGVDGIHVTVINASSGVADTLDYLGTGGDLDSILNTGNDWLEYRYDLSSIPPGTTVQVCFAFTSDNQYSHAGEGFYLDDVQVSPINDVIPGEVTGDGVIDIADVLFEINYLYKSGPAPYPRQAGDVTCDGEANIDDVIFLINYLYKHGPHPPASC